MEQKRRYLIVKEAPLIPIEDSILKTERINEVSFKDSQYRMDITCTVVLEFDSVPLPQPLLIA
jgi:hypothetical protein